MKCNNRTSIQSIHWRIAQSQAWSTAHSIAAADDCLVAQQSADALAKVDSSAAERWDECASSVQRSGAEHRAVIPFIPGASSAQSSRAETGQLEASSPRSLAKMIAQQQSDQESADQAEPRSAQTTQSQRPDQVTKEQQRRSEQQPFQQSAPSSIKSI